MSAPVPEIKVVSAIHGERVWRRIGVRAHITRDGREMVLAVWETPCVICGEPFEILSTMKVTSAAEGHNFQKLVTCPAHRMTMSESTALRFAGDYRRVVFEAIRRKKLNRSQTSETKKGACPSQRTRPYSTGTRQGPNGRT
jgi:hypothetical protein